MYKDKLYVLSFTGRLDDYANNSAFIVRISKSGNIEAKYNFAVNNANSRGEFHITGYAVIDNILYVRFNNENYISHIVRFNLDSFSYMNAAPIIGFNNTQQKYQYDSQTNNMRAVDDSLYTLFVDTNNKRYLARLSSEDYSLLDKVELTERYSSNTIDKCSINLITENNNLVGYFPDIYKDSKPESIAIFANPRMSSNSDYGMVIEEIYIDR